ncbi:uncharacterized protein TNCT_567501 [Trichonephila clavata]|uniref:Uncharacterized protein n=1 Tax=Trichonephila clavata TaxID=2740835 RepID=A0A8X6FT89_TRICU|nr:uncharacterized protein TNCT_567501 [Trichonephila clavata]
MSRFLDAAKMKMKEDGYDIENCISYLSNEKIISRDTWLDRMRNLAMSCAMVCLILLSFSAPLGLLGLFKKQISTIMVTGVMYILAGELTLCRLVLKYYYTEKDTDSTQGFY